MADPEEDWTDFVRVDGWRAPSQSGGDQVDLAGSGVTTKQFLGLEKPRLPGGSAGRWGFILLFNQRG